MKKGILKITVRPDGSIRQFIKSGKSKIPIPGVYILDESMHNEECEFETGANGIQKLLVGGKEISKDEEELQRRLQEKEEKEKQRKEAEAKAKKEAEEFRQQQQGNRGGQQPFQNKPDFVFNISKFSILPKDTIDTIAGKEASIDNLALRLNKGANFWEGNKNRATLYQLNKGSRKRGTRDELMRHLPEGEIQYGDLPFEELGQQTQDFAEAFCGKNQVWNEVIKTDGRLAIGIGSASVFEVGITLHHVYGIPYLPASGIKGLCRNWMISNDFDGSEGDALAVREFCDLFGCPAEYKDNEEKGHKSWYEKQRILNGKYSGEQKGKLMFFDAFPVAPPTIEEDIMNVHYPDYYQGKSAPTDFQSPNPIVFLTVAEGTPFHFVIGTKASPEMEKEVNKSGLLAKGRELLTQALTNHGIGAKTALGYGFFENPQS